MEAKSTNPQRQYSGEKITLRLLTHTASFDMLRLAREVREDAWLISSLLETKGRPGGLKRWGDPIRL